MNAVVFKRKTGAILRLSTAEKFWLFIAFLYSGFARLIILTLSFKRLARFLGAPHGNHQLSALATPAQNEFARRVKHVTGMACKYTPWRSACLVQAIVARRFLVHYGIPYVIHLGAKTQTNEWDKMEAHAWLMVGTLVVTGGRQSYRYGIVATYVAPELLP